MNPNINCIPYPDGYGMQLTGTIGNSRYAESTVGNVPDIKQHKQKLIFVIFINKLLTKRELCDIICTMLIKSFKVIK